MTSFALETVEQVLDEIKPLLAQHWEEIATYKDLPLDPDYEAYLRMAAAGRVRVFTARHEGVLIGYGVFFLGNLHYKGSGIATQDILFILPQYRGTTVGYRLIKFCDDSLRAEGLQVTYQHVKISHDFSPVLSRLGYRPVEIIYARRL